MVKLLALDQATKVSGYAFFAGKELKSYGVIEVENKDIYVRINTMKRNLIPLISQNKPDVVLVEDAQQQFGNVVAYKALVLLQGVIIDYLIEKNIAYVIVPPSVWRKDLGINKGRKREEKKAQAMEHVFNIVKKELPEDVCEAICIGLWGLKKVVKQ